MTSTLMDRPAQDPALARVRTRFLAALIDTALLGFLGLATDVVQFQVHGGGNGGFGVHSVAELLSYDVSTQLVDKGLGLFRAPLWDLMQWNRFSNHFNETRVTLLVLLAYAFVQGYLLATTGQTLGKRWTGLKIVDAKDGSAVGFARIFLLRTLLNEALRVIPFYILVDWLCLIPKGRRCLHDRLAGTRVVLCERPGLDWGRAGFWAVVAGVGLLSLGLMTGPFMPTSLAARYFFGQWEDGEDYFKDIEKAHPEDAEAFRCEGYFHAQEFEVRGFENDTEEALRAFGRVLALKPKDVNALVERGNLYYRMAFFDIAVIDSGTKDEDQPKFENQNKLRDFFAANPGYFLAITEAEAVRLETKFRPEEVLYWEADHQRQQFIGKVPRELTSQFTDYCAAVGLALRDYRAALALDPSDQSIVLAEGLALLAAKDPAAAQADVERVLQVEPDNAQAQMGLNRALKLKADLAVRPLD